MSTTSHPAADVDATRQQLEFYYSDANLARNGFLMQRIRESPDGYVPVATIASFNKLVALGADESLIFAAAQASPALEVDANKTAVRRRTPMPAAYNADDRTIYVEGFPKTTTIDHLRAFFEPYSHVLAVRLPKFHGGDPKGFAFVELALLEDVDRVLQELSDRPFSVPDVPSDPSLAEPLRIMTLAEWSDFKDSYKQIKKLVAKETKKQRAKQTQQALVLPPGRAAGQVKSVHEPYRTPFVPGVIIQLTELSPDSSKAGIAKELAHHGQVKFVEYTAGQAVASVRCVDASSAQAILRAAHSQAFPFKVSELRGGAEKKFWQTLWSAQDAKHSIKPAVKNEPFKREVEPERPASHTAASKRSLSESLESDAIVAAQPSSSTTTEAPAAKKRRTTRRKKKSHGAATGAAARVHTFFEIEEEERDDQGENE